MTHDVERVFADIDADHGDRCVEFLRHGVLLVLSAPCQLLVLAGPEHGRTIPLSDIGPGRTAAHDAAMMDIELPEPGVRLEQRARRAATDGYHGGGCRRL